MPMLSLPVTQINTYPLVAGDDVNDPYRTAEVEVMKHFRAKRQLGQTVYCGRHDERPHILEVLISVFGHATIRKPD